MCVPDTHEPRPTTSAPSLLDDRNARDGSRFPAIFAQMDVVLFQQAIQAAPIDAQSPRRARFVAALSAEHVKDMGSLNVGQMLPFDLVRLGHRPGHGSGRDLVRQVFHAD